MWSCPWASEQQDRSAAKAHGIDLPIQAVSVELEKRHATAGACRSDPLQPGQPLLAGPGKQCLGTHDRDRQAPFQLLAESRPQAQPLQLAGRLWARGATLTCQQVLLGLSGTCRSARKRERRHYCMGATAAPAPHPDHSDPVPVVVLLIAAVMAEAPPTPASRTGHPTEQPVPAS